MSLDIFSFFIGQGYIFSPKIWIRSTAPFFFIWIQATGVKNKPDPPLKMQNSSDLGHFKFQISKNAKKPCHIWKQDSILCFLSSFTSTQNFKSAPHSVASNCHCFAFAKPCSVAPKPHCVASNRYCFGFWKLSSVILKL